MQLWNYLPGHRVTKEDKKVVTVILQTSNVVMRKGVSKCQAYKPSQEQVTSQCWLSSWTMSPNPFWDAVPLYALSPVRKCFSIACGLFFLSCVPKLNDVIQSRSDYLITLQLRRPCKTCLRAWGMLPSSKSCIKCGGSCSITSKNHILKRCDKRGAFIHWKLLWKCVYNERSSFLMLNLPSVLT